MDPIHILLAEDDEGDFGLVKKSMERSKLHVDLARVEDGETCLRYLRKQENYADVREPDLLLLDLNMPGKDGREVLAEMKNDRLLRHIPVVILTTSAADTDVAKSYDLGANCFVSKPVDFQQFQKVVQEISSFWFTVVRLPHNEKK